MEALGFKNYYQLICLSCFEEFRQDWEHVAGAIIVNFAFKLLPSFQDNGERPISKDVLTIVV